MKIAAVVPSLNPDEAFLRVVRQLADAGFERIYLVNDGSRAECGALFRQAAALPGCILLSHAENRGKGRALKTAFAHYLQNPGGCLGLVTLDGDGQHHIDDVVKVAEALLARPGALVLGCRDFTQKDVPAKSMLGNRITRGVFRFACGIPVSDTQTGLRGIPNGFARELLDIGGERYEFETNMLLAAGRSGLPFSEVPIRTIYINANAASYFRPLKDGARIYWLILRFMFFKFILSSAAGSLLDLLLFAALHAALYALAPGLRLLFANSAARVSSALFNFFMNKTLVFAGPRRKSGAMPRYFALAACQLGASYGGIYLLSAVLGLPAVPAKIITDTLLFFASFHIQRRWVFGATPP